jgi:hypothetical protein
MARSVRRRNAEPHHSMSTGQSKTVFSSDQQRQKSFLLVGVASLGVYAPPGLFPPYVRARIRR